MPATWVYIGWGAGSFGLPERTWSIYSFWLGIALRSSRSNAVFVFGLELYRFAF